MLGSFQKFRKVLIIVVMAVFIELPFGFVFLDVFSNRSQLLFNVISLAAFAAGAARLGNLIASKLEHYDAEHHQKMKAGLAVDVELQKNGENRMKMNVMMLGVIFVISLLYELAHPPYSSTSWGGLVGVFSLVVVFFFLFILYERKRSPWTKKFCLLLFVVALTNFVIGTATLLMRPQAANLAPVLQLGYQGQGSVIALGAYATPLGAVTVVVPVGFETIPLNADTILIRPATSAAIATTPSLVVGATSSSLSAVLGRQLALLAQIQYIESTTTFAGYQADTISFVQTNGHEQTIVSTIVFEANGMTFDVAENKIVSPALYQGADDALQEILKSMKVTAL
jgi:hypothetical protein